MVYEAYNETEEASYVCDEIERLMSSGTFSSGDFAVMYRTNAQSRALEEAFVQRHIAYKLIGATRFYERKEIKDVLSYLKLVHNPATPSPWTASSMCQHAASGPRRILD